MCTTSKSVSLLWFMNRSKYIFKLVCLVQERCKQFCRELKEVEHTKGQRLAFGMITEDWLKTNLENLTAISILPPVKAFSFLRFRT